MKLKEKTRRVVASVLVLILSFEVSALNLFGIKSYAASGTEGQTISVGQPVDRVPDLLGGGIGEDTEAKLGNVRDGTSKLLEQVPYFSYDMEVVDGSLPYGNWGAVLIPYYKHSDVSVGQYDDGTRVGFVLIIVAGQYLGAKYDIRTTELNKLSKEFYIDNMQYTLDRGLWSSLAIDGGRYKSCGPVKVKFTLKSFHSPDKLSSFLGDTVLTGEDIPQYLNAIFNLSSFYAASNGGNILDVTYSEAESVEPVLRNYDCSTFSVDSSGIATLKSNNRIKADLTKYRVSYVYNGQELDSAYCDSIAKINNADAYVVEKKEKVVNDILANTTEEIDAVGDQAQGNTGSQAADDATQQAQTDGTSIQQWFYAINNFFVTGETEDADHMPDLKLEDYGTNWIEDRSTASTANNNHSTSQGGHDPDDPGAPSNTGNAGSGSLRDGEAEGTYNSTYNKVNMEEDLRIRIYYNILRNYLPLKDDVADAVNDAIETNKLDEIFSLKYTTAATDYNPDAPTTVMTPEMFKLRSNDSVAPLTSAQDEATKASDLFTPEADKPSLKTTANHFDAIVRYFYYGVITPNAEYSSQGGGTTNIVKLNENIDKIVPLFKFDTSSSGTPDEEQSVANDMVSFESLGLPSLPQTKEIGNSVQSIEKYGQIMLTLMYIKRWAAVGIDSGSNTTEVEETTEGTESDGAEGDEGDEAEDEGDEGDDGGSQQPAASGRYYQVGAKSRYSGLEMTRSENVPIEDAKADDFANKDLDEWLEKISTEEDESKRKPTEDVASYIQYYTQIYKGLTYLGCKSGTTMYDKWIGPELQCIMNYYEKIKEFENVVSAQVNEQAEGDEQAFPNIFNDDEKAFMAHYCEGVAASATYIPLITNLYNPDAWAVIPEESFIDEFHYKYGFLRKALYRDTSANAAMSNYVTGNIGKLVPVTLRDFIENDGSDVVLYIDPKMYRIDKVADKFALAYTKLQNTEDSGENADNAIDSIAHAVSTWMETDAESICKTGTAKVYSQAMANKTDPKGVRNPRWPWDNMNHYIMTDEDIEYYVHGDGSEEDEIQKTFAVVSGIYRDKSVFNIAQNESADPKPVFVSSKTLCNVKDATQEDFNTLYNYMMVVNLKNKQGMDYEVDMDMDSPLFMDVYGNICTMSGIVVIPAVSNATLYNSTNYDAANAGVASLYNDLDSVKIKESWLRNKDMLDSTFKVNKEGFYEMQNKVYTSGESGGVTLAFANLALSSTNVKQKMYEIAYSNAMSTESDSSGIAGSKFNRRVNLILEVLRGADVEDIDLMKEGLDGTTSLDKTGIYIAYRVEQLGSLIMSNSNGNSLLELPNLAFMPGLEYIVVVLFKVLFAVMIVLLMFQIYLDGVADTLGVVTIVRFITTIASIIISVVALPSLINFSYYHVNKLLLQNEATYMEMLNLEKKMNGQEISIRQNSTGQPQTTTKFYLKLDEIKVPWWSVITDVLASDSFTKMQEIYDNAMESSVYSQFGDGTDESIIKRGNSMYASIDWLFSTSRVEFAPYSENSDSPLAEDKTAGYLYQNVPDSPKMSYLLPYYAILDNLLLRISEYNETNNVAGYTSVPSGNDNEQILTRGLIKPYLTSFNFMEADCDLLGLYSVYGIDPPKDTGTIFTEDEIAQMRRSLWCNYEGLTEKQIKSNLEKLDYEARKFIVENRGMLDKVSDVTFMKCLALYLATRHNSMMKVPACRGLEIYAMDTRDVMRLSLTNKNAVMKGSQKSFEKFCFDVGGTFSIILAGFLEVIYWITSLIKPSVMIILVGALIFSYIYKKLIRLEGNHSLEGYLTSVALLCLTNIIYACVIKLSMWIPNYTNSIIMCLLGQILLQVGYSLLMLFIATTVLRDLHDIGFYTYKTIYDTHMANKVHSLQMNAHKLMAGSIFSPDFGKRRRYDHTDYSRTRDVTGSSILTDMKEREDRRRDNVYNNRR